jgi:hypothetical protein
MEKLTGAVLQNFFPKIPDVLSLTCSSSYSELGCAYSFLFICFQLF